MKSSQAIVYATHTGGQINNLQTKKRGGIAHSAHPSVPEFFLLTPQLWTFLIQYSFLSLISRNRAGVHRPSPLLFRLPAHPEPPLFNSLSIVFYPNTHVKPDGRLLHITAVVGTSRGDLEKD